MNLTLIKPKARLDLVYWGGYGVPALGDTYSSTTWQSAFEQDTELHIAPSSFRLVWQRSCH